ncbi:NYN domain-containing protein [Chitinibacter sp. SCUT-21]|uniref:NYN domain-containing protein n=1 Tax=Chitinibacter sp. SCUT-21 TaxID=2970891 RepID=UPI0035A60BFE
MANVAVLIDADNFQRPEWVSIALREASALGVIALKRVYGNFHLNYEKWMDLCAKHAIEPIQQFPNTKGKNASDIALVIDAMDLLHSKRYDSFCILSSDSDFSRLAIRIRQNGHEVLGFGEQKTPNAFVNACSKFVYIEFLTLEDDSLQVVNDKESTKNKEVVKQFLTPDKKLRATFKKAIDASCDDDGWADLGGIGNLITKWFPDFDPRNYGVKKLSELINKTGWFEFKAAQRGKHGPMIKLKLNASTS